MASDLQEPRAKKHGLYSTPSYAILKASKGSSILLTWGYLTPDSVFQASRVLLDSRHAAFRLSNSPGEILDQVNLGDNSSRAISLEDDGHPSLAEDLG